MYLFISDVHFGKGARCEERAKETDLLRLFDFVGEDMQRLYLLGDIFDQFIEYRHLVPKGFIHFQSALGNLTSSGIPVVYVVGNHDPWHLDYFEEELGVTIVRESHDLTLGGLRIRAAHGDGLDRGGLARVVRRATRHRISMALYRTLLPSDWGYRLARFSKRRLESAQDPEPETIDRLCKAAHRTLGGGYDLVVLGHSHEADLRQWPEGTYVNAGSWHHRRTLVAIDGPAAPPAADLGGRSAPPQVCRIRQGRWNGGSVTWYSDVRSAAQGSASASQPTIHT